MAAPAWAQLQEPSARAAAGEKGGSFRVDPMSRHRCRIELMTRIQVQGRCLLVDHIMSAKTKVTKTKTAALTGKLVDCDLERGGRFAKLKFDKPAVKITQIVRPA